jgi:ABC-type glycerol-3-phosphate transport system permease component
LALSDKARKNTRKSISFMFLFVLCLFWIVPIFFLVILSLKTTGDYASNAYYSLPHEFGFFENIKYVWVKTNLSRPYINSIIYAVVSSGAAIFISSLAAYAIAKLKVRGAFTIFIILWSGMIFPIQIFLIPLYKAYITLKLYNTQIGMILIYTALSIPFCVFVFRNYFLTLPDDYQEAAKIDGCNNFQIYWRILMPNSLGPVAVLLIFQGSWVWNDLIIGMILSKSFSVRPVMNALTLLQGQYSGTNVPAVMTGNLIASLPMIILFIALQKYFMQGLSLQAAGE